jgi:hypothetical protein
MLGSVGSPDMDQALITTASLEVVSARRAVPEWIESMNLTLARKSQLLGSVLGRLCVSKRTHTSGGNPLILEA